MIRAAPEPYLRNSMPKKFASVDGDFDADGMFEEGTFAGEIRKKNVRGGICGSQVAETTEVMGFKKQK